MSTIAERMFDGGFAESELNTLLLTGGLDYQKSSFDHYDCSLELHGVADDYRMPENMQKIIYNAGFAKVYVNHINKWETHYSWDRGAFKPVDGWRVSYPSKRGPEETEIWVERDIPDWPRKWFDSGCVVIK